jgi:hypothetical protein
MPERIQLSRKKGWKMPPNTVVVARPTRWGNPFCVKKYGRAGAVEMFRKELERCGLSGLHELRGKNLACWCKLGEPCHADVLLEKANAI